MEDRHILELLWNRAESAIDALRTKFGRRLHMTAMNILGNAQDAEEAVNDTYLALWDAIPPARPDPLPAFVYKVGRNVALKFLRLRSAQKRNSGYDLSLEELAGVLPAGTLEEQLDARELGRAIDRFLDTLDDESRILFVRRYWFGDSVKALAASRGMTQSAVSVRLHRVRSELKDYLNKEGVWL